MPASPVPHVTREMLNSQPTNVPGGTNVEGLFIRDVDEFIPIMKEIDATFIKKIPTGGTVNKLKYEYGEGDHVPTSVKTTNPADATATSLTVDFPKYVQQYDLLRNQRTGEQVRVTLEPGAALTIVRGHGGSNAAAINAGDEWKILGPAVPEGADTPTSPSAQGNLDFNYPQIMEYSWSVTHRGRVTPTYEIKTDRFKHELKIKMEEAARDLNYIAIFGLRSPGDGTRVNPSTTGGALQFTTANVVEKAGAPFKVSDLLDMLQKQYEDVGQSQMSKDIIGNIRTKRILNSFLNPQRRATVTDAKLNLKLDEIDTDFGPIKFVIDGDWPDGMMHTFNFKDIKRYAYEGGNWSTGMFSTEGWYDRGFLRGDFGFKWAAPRRRGAVVNFDTNPASYPNYDSIGA